MKFIEKLLINLKCKQIMRIYQGQPWQIPRIRKRTFQPSKRNRTMSKPRTIAEYPNRADDYDEAVSKSHVQNTDTVLDQGGDNEVTAEEIRDHVDSTDNPHQVTADQVGAYTKGEVGDLLDDKADQSALNATNQAVSNLDGRVHTAEDDIQDLEDSYAPVSDPIFSGVFGYGQSVRMRYDNSMPSSPGILLAQANHPEDRKS